MVIKSSVILHVSSLPCSTRRFSYYPDGSETLAMITKFSDTWNAWIKMSLTMDSGNPGTPDYQVSTLLSYQHPQSRSMCQRSSVHASGFVLK